MLTPTMWCGAVQGPIKEQESTREPRTIKWIFFDRLGDFLEGVLEQNQKQILNNDTFMQPIITSCTTLIKGLWTSYRMVAVAAGMKIMTSLHSCNEDIILDLSAPDLPDLSKAKLKEKKENIFQYWYQLFKNVFKFAIRDVCREVRSQVISEMFRWTSKYPSFLLGRRWKKYIHWALRDSDSFN
ncbi:uncharacterized protein [Rhodnius prolixus]|uniref:uncharacterized protein n=1 Tax=Rhodnius prolixus TaxID=13249 RepID=UPI003D1885AE